MFVKRVLLRQTIEDNLNYVAKKLRHLQEKFLLTRQTACTESSVSMLLLSAGFANLVLRFSKNIFYGRCFELWR
jgi:hypothetical protein